MPPRRTSPYERFVGLVVIDNATGCWDWAGTTNKGYAFLSIGGKPHSAHRWSYEHHIGPIPDGLQIDHLCRNRRCVNPTHLEPVTQRENILRGEAESARRARQTHCKRGHALTPDKRSATASVRPATASACTQRGTVMCGCDWNWTCPKCEDTLSDHRYELDEPEPVEDAEA